MPDVRLPGCHRQHDAVPPRGAAAHGARRLHHRTLHESTAPLVEPRKVMYTPFTLALRPGDVPAPVDSSALREGVYKRLLEDIA